MQGSVTYADGLNAPWTNPPCLPAVQFHEQQRDMWGQSTFCRFEVLFGSQEVIPYFDWDLHLDHRPTDEVLKHSEQSCIDKVHDVMSSVGLPNTDGSDYQILMAQRHGVVPKTGKWKSSLRAYVRGVKVVMADMKQIIIQAGQDDFWDISVYNESKRKLGIVGSCKGVERDYRVLTPIGDWDPTLATVQLLTGNERLIAPSPEHLDLQPPTKKRKTASVVYGGNANGLFQATKGNLERLFGSIKQIYPKHYGFDFHLVDTSKACFCTHVHDSNAFRCEEVFGACVQVVNYSKKCHIQLVGWRDHPLIKQLIHLPTSDTGYVDIFITSQELKGFVWKYDTGKDTFYKFDGTIWQKAEDMEVQQEVQQVCGQLLKALLTNMCYNKATASEDDSRIFRAFTQASKHITKSSSLKNAANMARTTLFDQQLKFKLDADGDLLGCASGIIHLPTGDLITNNPAIYVSHQATTSYEGLYTPTPLIDAFFASIFNDDQEVIDYIQRLLGYGLVGTQKEQCWVVCLGSGSNGKSLLNRMLTQVMGPDYFHAMERDVIFQNDRKTTAGQATSHLAMLEKRRIAILDDAEEGGVLNDRVIKQMTGGALLTCRLLYKNPISFFPTHLPILLTNHRPKLNVDDDAMKRRLIMVPFLNVYKPAHELDPTNPRHRLRDDTLETTLLSDEGMHQFLTWLVKGSVEWSKRGLGQRPQLLMDANQEMYAENDILGAFIREKCNANIKGHVSTKDFKEAFERYQEASTTSEKLKKTMVTRGFKCTDKKVAGRSVRSFLGVSLKDDKVDSRD